MRSCIVLLIVLAGACSVAQAQIVTPSQQKAIEGSVNPGRVGDSLESRAPIPKAVPTEKKKEKVTSSAIPDAEKIKFKINGFRLEGNTVFTTEALMSLYTKGFGREISLKDVEDFVSAISTKYRQAGYILSRAIIPEQKIAKGIVNVKVVEGFIDKVTVTGNAKAKKLLKAYGEHIAASHPLKVDVLERYALLMNDISGVTARTVLSPSKTAQGAADLTIISTQKAVDGYFSFDNRGTKYLGPEQATLSLTSNAMLSNSSATGARVVASRDGRELRFFEMNHTQTIGTNGGRLYFEVSRTKTRAGFDLFDLDVLGKSDSGSVEFQYPLIRSRRKNLYLTAKLKLLNSFTDILGDPFFKDKTRSFTLGSIYDFADSKGGVNLMLFDVDQGLDIFGASRKGSEFASRADGRPKYTKLDFSYSRTKWLTTRTSTLMAIKLQYSFSQLLSAQQFGVGGSDFGRGYDPSAITGDRGAAAKLEVRFDTKPDFSWIQSLRYYMFTDAGVVFNIHHNRNNVNRESLWSVGAGARANFTSRFSGYVELGQPMTLGVATENDAEKARLFFGLFYVIGW